MRLQGAGADRVARETLEVGAPTPLGAGWTMGDLVVGELAMGREWPRDVIPGLSLLTPDADSATRWAKGHLRVENGVLKERQLGRDRADDAASVDEDASDQGDDACAVPCALDASDMTLAS
eukprot:2513312-Prymnesium_polylepis.1